MENNQSTVETGYYDGFQYSTISNAMRLDFIMHAEGAVEVTYNNFFLSPPSYNYVFHHTDHLGNIRLRYGVDPSDQTVKILEESHYYPFGLKQEGYNTGRIAFKSVETGNTINLTTVDPFLGDSFKYKYQGQERQEELGLNWYSFKWRNYDPAIARFMTIDPLAEIYNWMTPYQFSSNQPIHAPELEGLESANDLNSRDPNLQTEGADSAVIQSEATVADFVTGALGRDQGEGFAAQVLDNYNDGNKTSPAMGPVLNESSREGKGSGTNNSKTVSKKTNTGKKNTENLRKTAKVGQEAHRQIQKDLKAQGADIEVPLTLKDGTNVRKDAIQPDGTVVIIKPNTTSGQNAASKRSNLMQDNGYNTQIILYDPQDPAYQPGSPTYIGPKNKKNNGPN